MLIFKDGANGPYSLSVEFHTQLDPLTRFAVEDLQEVVSKRFGSDLTVTCVLRTPSQNEEVGGVKQSAHIPGVDGIGRAVDLRSSSFTEAEKAFILKYMEKRWGPVVHFILHNAGTAPHFHLNVNYQYARAQAYVAAGLLA